jgi:hypothetical protein
MPYMPTDEEKRKMTIVAIAIVAIVAGYLVAAYAGYVPADYNVFEMAGGEDVEPEPQLTAGEAEIVGIPSEVNVTDTPEANYTLTIYCNESYVDGMEFVAEVDDADYAIFFTAISTDWQISDDGLTATYVGNPLSASVSIENLVLHIDGTDGTEEATATITATATLGEFVEDEFSIDLVL